MAKLSIRAGTTSKLIDVFVQDSTSTSGTGLTSVVASAAGFTSYAYREGAAVTSVVTKVTITVGTWTSGGWGAIDDVNMPGMYQFGIPNWVLAAGAQSAIIYFKGATNMAPLPLEIELTQTDNQNAVTGGLTALPSATPGTAGSLIIAGANLETAFTSVTVSGTLRVMGGVGISQSNSNTAGVSITGNGTHPGMWVKGGATAAAIWADGGATSGEGMVLTGTGGLAGLTITTGASAPGALRIQPAGQGAGIFIDSSGPGLHIQASNNDGIIVSSTNGNAINLHADEGHGINIDVDGTSTFHAIFATTSATAGDGLRVVGAGTGSGIWAQGGAGATGDGITAISSATDGAGIVAQGRGSRAGLRAIGGATGQGIAGIGGSTSGPGMQLTTQAGTSHGLHIQGINAGHGILVSAGATGDGFKIVGGSTSGNGVTVSVTSGMEIDADLNGAVSAVWNLPTSAVAQIYNYLTASASVVGSYGLFWLSAADINISAVASAVWTQPSRTITGGVSVTNIATSAVAQVWDYLTASVSVVGSMGTLIVTNLDRPVSAVASAVWDYNVSAITSAGTAGAQLNDAAAGGGGSTDVNVVAIAGVSAAADKLSSSTKGIVTGTVGIGSSSTSIVTSTLSPTAVDTDQFKGKVLTFLSDTTTTGLRGESTAITASSNGGVLTVSQLSQAPASGDTFVIT